MHTVNDEVPYRFLYADLAALQSPVRQDACDQVERTFVLVPGAHVIAESHALANRRFLEIGRDKSDVTLGRNDRAGKSFRAPPADAGEID